MSAQLEAAAELVRRLGSPTRGGARSISSREEMADKLASTIDAIAAELRQ